MMTGSHLLGGWIFGIGWVFWVTVLEPLLEHWVKEGLMHSE